MTFACFLMDNQSAVTCRDVSQEASILLHTFSHMMQGKHIAIGNKRIEKTNYGK